MVIQNTLLQNLYQLVRVDGGQHLLFCQDKVNFQVRFPCKFFQALCRFLHMVQFYRYLRPEQKFDSLQKLQEQIRRDEEKVREMLQFF